MPITTNPPTVDELAEALVDATPELDEQGRRIVLTTYQLLSKAEPVTNEQVARVSGEPPADVTARLGAWPGVYRNSDEAIVGFWGLALKPLDPEYRLERPGQAVPPVYAWCAWDTLFLPSLIGDTLEVTAADGHTGRPVTLTVSPAGVTAVDPEDSAVTFLVPDGPFDADVVASFCHKVLFFANETNAAAWIETRRDQLFSVSVAEAFDVGRLVVKANYGDSLPG